MKESEIFERLVRMCNSTDRYVSAEYIECAWDYCKLFDTEAVGIKVLAERLSKTHGEIVTKAAEEWLAKLGENGLGFGAKGALLTSPEQYSKLLVSREFMHALVRVFRNVDDIRPPDK